jgi:hypothetical protein
MANWLSRSIRSSLTRTLRAPFLSIRGKICAALQQISLIHWLAMILPVRILNIFFHSSRVREPTGSLLSVFSTPVVIPSYLVLFHLIHHLNPHALCNYGHHALDSCYRYFFSPFPIFNSDIFWVRLFFRRWMLVITSLSPSFSFSTDIFRILLWFQ